MDSVMAAKVPKYSRTSLTRHRQPDPVRSITTRSQTRSSGCFFQSLPPEVFAMVLDRLAVLDIGVLSMVSKDICVYVAGHISTLEWRNRMIPQTLQREPSAPCPTAHYTALGLLFKRCTLLLPTRERLKFIYSKFSQSPCFTMERWTSATAVGLGFSCYGVFLQTLTAGWDELECHRVFHFLCNLTNLPRKIEIVVTGKPGESRYLEMQVRLFCRGVLLDHWPTRQDSVFWLSCILNRWPLVSQARLLFILYGPVLPDGSLDWQAVWRAPLPRGALQDLAGALHQLHTSLTESSCWMTVLEELTVLPQAWNLENVARLLVKCCDSLCGTVLVSKAINGRLAEISRLIVYVVLVCEKDGYCMRWMADMVHQVSTVLPNTAAKWAFIQDLEETFSAVVMEMYESALAGNRLQMDFFQSLSVVLNANAHFHTEFHYAFLREE